LPDLSGQMFVENWGMKYGQGFQGQHGPSMLGVTAIYRWADGWYMACDAASQAP